MDISSLLTAQIEGIILLAIVAGLLFGPKKIPELARGLGRAIGEFKHGRAELEHKILTISKEVN
jgi:sec-independent protein translocase protein TatA